MSFLNDNDAESAHGEVEVDESRKDGDGVYVDYVVADVPSNDAQEVGGAEDDGEVDIASSSQTTQEKRKLQKKRSKRRTLERGNAQLRVEKVSLMIWCPRRCSSIVPIVGIHLHAI